MRRRRSRREAADTLSEQPSRPRVLIVDDVLDQLDLYAMVLEPHVEVSRASRGEMAIAMALVHPPDAIVLDLLLPDVDGFEVCRRLRVNSATADVPIIFLTGDEPSLFKAMASPECANVFAILKKPATGDHLLNTIHAALKASRRG